MEEKIYGLMLSMHFVDDEEKSSRKSEICLCCSYDKEKIDHYCSVFNEASKIRLKLRPVNTMVEVYRVKVLDLL